MNLPAIKPVSLLHFLRTGKFRTGVIAV